MNPKSSSVVWGIPQLTEDILENTPQDVPEDDGRFIASMLGDGSLTMIVVLSVLGVAAAALTIIMASKNKKVSEKTEDEE